MSESTETKRPTPAGATESGRYLYCLVETGTAVPNEPANIGVTGIDDEPVFVVTAADTAVGAVVHARETPYDSAELTTLRDWLLAHQRVVEGAGDRFGTPLPVRFDTVLEGDNDAVTAWLARNADTIRDAFASIAGRWEYRVTLSWDSTAFEAEQRTADAELADIDRRLNQSGAGKRFLLQKQYEKRLRDLTRARREELKDRLVDQLAADSVQIAERPLQSEAAASLGVELESDAVAQVAILASRDDEQTLGDTLEGFTDIQGVAIRFTGPWPPYTFAPTITDD